MTLLSACWLSLVLATCVKTCNCETLDMSLYQRNILSEHNEFRKMERASNMHLMKWNSTIARQAANWVERCDFKHEMSGVVGENLAFDSNPGDPWDIMKSSVNSWHDEKREWRYGKGACGHACHYTQMVWATTKQIGCAAKKCSSLNAFGRSIKNALYLVCYYYPRGNWVGEYPYIPGAPCSKCEKGCTCTDTLCDDNDGGISNVIQTVPAPAAPSLVRVKGGDQKTAALTSTGTVHRGQSHSWQWTTRDKNRIQFHRRQVSHWQSVTRGRKPATLLALPLHKSVTHVIKSPTTSARCIDRLPSCRYWHRQCNTSRVVQMSCSKTCKRCDGLNEVVGFSRSAVKPHRNNDSRTRRKQKANRTRGRTARNLNLPSPPRSPQRRGRNEVTKHRARPGRFRVRTAGRKRRFRDRRVQMVRRRRISPRRRQNHQRQQACADDAKYAGRCKYWHESGFCAENQIMRDVFCRKTCGRC